MSSNNDRALRSKPPLRLRIPASLAVAVVGVSATLAMSFGGCQENVPEPIDAGGPIDRTRDAGPDGLLPDEDGGDGVDAGVDGQLADAAVTPPDAPRDAFVPPPDAPVG